LFLLLAYNDTLLMALAR